MIDNLSKPCYHDILENCESRVWNIRVWKNVKIHEKYRRTSIYIDDYRIPKDLKASSCCLEDNIARGFEVRRRYQKG